MKQERAIHVSGRNVSPEALADPAFLECVETMSKQLYKNAAVKAAEHMDWVQVVLNGGPPCFHIERDGHFCCRAEAWHDHDTHEFISLAAIAKEIAG